MEQAELERRIYELVGYTVTSGRNQSDETPAYGPFRLVDAVSRLVGILEEAGLASPRLLWLKGFIEDGKYSVMGTGFEDFLEGLVYAYLEGLEEGGDSQGESGAA